MEPTLSPDIDRLLDQLHSKDPGDRRMAAADLGQLDCRDDRVRLALEAVALDDQDSFARSEALWALEVLGFQKSPELLQKIASAPGSPELELPELKDVARMDKSIRLWSIGFVLFGSYYILTMLQNGGIFVSASVRVDPLWGIILLTIAILSWRIRIPAMFVIYAVTIGWHMIRVGTTLLFTGMTMLVIPLLFQIGLIFILVNQFRKYRHLRLQELFQAGKWPANLALPRDEVVVAGNFARVSLILAGAMVILVPITCLGVFILIGVSAGQIPQQLVWFDLIVASIVGIAALALALGLAAILTGNNKKGQAVAGVVMSTLVLLGWLVITLLMGSFRMVAGN